MRRAASTQALYSSVLRQTVPFSHCVFVQVCHLCRSVSRTGCKLHQYQAGRDHSIAGRVLQARMGLMRAAGAAKDWLFSDASLPIRLDYDR